MTTQPRTSPSPLLWISVIAIVLFCGVGVAAMMGWLPTSYGEQDTEIAAEVASHTDQPAAVTSKAICTDCGVIESIQLFNDVKETSGVGIVGGAVVGGLLGNQIGGGSGKDIATVAGAVGGGFAGNEIEKRVGTTQHYEIVVRFDDGSSRVFTQANPPAWQSGDRVRIIDGVIRSNN